MGLTALAQRHESQLKRLICSPQIKIIEMPSKNPVCTLTPDTKLGMVMCVQLWKVS